MSDLLESDDFEREIKRARKSPLYAQQLARKVAAGAAAATDEHDRLLWGLRAIDVAAAQFGLSAGASMTAGFMMVIRRDARERAEKGLKPVAAMTDQEIIAYVRAPESDDTTIELADIELAGLTTELAALFAGRPGSRQILYRTPKNHETLH